MKVRTIKSLNEVEKLFSAGVSIYVESTGKWIVKWADIDSDDIQIARFDTEKEARDWAKNKEVLSRYERDEFEVFDIILEK